MLVLPYGVNESTEEIVEQLLSILVQCICKVLPYNWKPSQQNMQTQKVETCCNYYEMGHISFYRFTISTKFIPFKYVRFSLDILYFPLNLGATEW